MHEGGSLLPGAIRFCSNVNFKLRTLASIWRESAMTYLLCGVMRIRHSFGPAMVLATDCELPPPHKGLEIGGAGPKG